MTTPESFEDRLLAQLRLVVAERPVPPDAAATAIPGGPRVRRGRLALAGAVAAATAGAAVVATSGDVTPSAYAVQPRGDGAVTVHIRSLADADGLQRELRAAGVPAVVSYSAAGSAGCDGPGTTPGAGGAPTGAPGPVTQVGGAAMGTRFHTERGKRSDPGDGPSTTRPGLPPGTGAGVPPRGRASTGVRIEPDGVTFTIDPGTVPSGEHVYITTSTGEVSSVAMSLGERPAGAPCLPPPPPKG